MQNLSLCEEFEWSGVWYLPTQPEIRYKGSLSGGPEGIDLRVVGEDRELIGLLGYASRNHQNLLGNLANGEKVTLFHCFTKSHSENTCEIIANGALFGLHIADLATLNVKKIIGAVDDKGWVDCFSPIEHARNACSDKRRQFHIGQPEFLEVGFLPSKNLTTRIGWGFKEKVSRGRYEFNSNSHIELEYSDACHFWAALKDFNVFRTLVSVLAGQEVRRISISIFASECGSEERNEVASVYMPLRSPRSARQEVVARPLTSLNNLVSRMPSIVRNWFEMIESEPSIQQILASEFSNEVFGEEKFLSLVRLLEALSRFTASASIMKREEFRETVVPALLQALPEGLPPGVVDDLRNKIICLNLKSLRNSLLSMVVAGGFKESAVDIDLLKEENIGRLVKTRNYLTHQDEKNSKGVFSGGDFFAAIEQAQTFALIVIYRRMGFEADEIIRTFRRFYPFYGSFHHKFDGSATTYFAHEEC